MTLSDDKIIKLIEKGVSDNLYLARKKAKKVNMHITGKNVVDFLKRLDDYETHAQKLLREKLVKSNRSLFSFILRPTDKVFTAKGGSVSYNLPQEDIGMLSDKLSDIADGLDIKKYLKKVVKKHYFIDPNAVLFIDVDGEGMLETHVVTSNDIMWYETKGNVVKSIIFEPYRREISKEEQVRFNAISVDRLKREQDKLYYRVIDSSTDRVFVNDGGRISEQTSSRSINYFGFVPALILGDEKNPNEDIFESFIADVIDDADALLRLVSTSTIHDLAHLYPRYWEYATECNRCKGEGTITVVVDDVVSSEEVCGSCGGDGYSHRTNPSDAKILQQPQDGEVVIAPNVAGFVSPDLMTAKFYQEKMDIDRNRMFQATWGTTYQQGGKRETATGRFLDAQPVQDKLGDMSDTFAKMHKFMLDCYGKVLLRKRGYESYVSYGKRYILESPDDILKKYMEGTKTNISETVILDLRKQYFDAEYQSDTFELQKNIKLSNIEPFPTMTPGAVMALASLPEDDRLRKMYYSTWLNSLSEAEKVFLNEDQLRTSLDNYITSKQLIKDEPEQSDV